MHGNVSDRLREIQRNAGWSQDQLAAKLGVPPRTLYSWINNKSRPHDTNLQKVESLYFDVVGRGNVSPEQLNEAKRRALQLHMDAQELINNRDLLDFITLYLTYHTNSIEGSTMTVEDVKTVLDDTRAVLANKTITEQMEARNHRAALDFLLDKLNDEGANFRWTTDLILQTHLRLTNGIISDAGMFRRYGVRVLGASTARANWVSVPDKIAALVKEMNQITDDPIDQMTKVHAQYELIHPFGDGNGRTGRLFMFIMALQNNLMPPLVTKERKRAYYKYLDIADRGDGYELLELFIAESMVQTDELIKHPPRELLG